jgi:hypothetical protein
LAEGGKEYYVPSRFNSMVVIHASEGNDGFKPRRGRSEKNKDDEEPNKDKEVVTHTRFATKETKPSFLIFI